MYNNYEIIYIIDYKSYLTISVCMHSFVKRAYTHSWVYGPLTNSCIQTDNVK